MSAAAASTPGARARLTWLLALALTLWIAGLAAAGTAAGQEPEPQASLPDLEDEVNCVVCGVTLDRATEAPQALQQRELIRELIAEGMTKDEIKDQLVAEYGEDVLATPATSGFDLFAWLVPAAIVLAAAGGIAVGLRRWRRAAPVPEGPAPDPIDDDERRRLDEDLKRHGL